LKFIDAADVDGVGSSEALGELTPDLVGIGAIDAEDVDGVGSWEVVGGLASDSAGTKDANEYTPFFTLMKPDIASVSVILRFSVTINTSLRGISA
jgi:hypothetical protein